MIRNSLISSVAYQRAAGVLLHITSLPGMYGIGDLGSEARKFVNFLQRAGQTYWQILPLNPVEKSKGYSPYSSISSVAGNTLLISPEELQKDGLLEKTDLRKYKIDSRKEVNFEEAHRIKSALFDKAYQRFIKSRNQKDKRKFVKFCLKEKLWLDNYAHYVLLKNLHHGKPWNDWETAFKEREQESLKSLTKEFDEELKKIKWLQFIFFTQWAELKVYSNSRGIKLFGDLPFYISYDSADVWSYREFFSLQKNGQPDFVAGVPPDYFNQDGQLWGMPVFRWDKLAKTNYSWWVQRLKKNIELFDLLRLDHFRAFTDYWAVPANESTARNGNWKPGPGRKFFDVVLKELKELPFVAEDLGDINTAVHELRDQFQFPGMKILHFAFSDNMAVSDHIPHNYTPNFIAYTGTHDNNTTKGWYRKDLSVHEKDNLKEYLNTKVTSRNIHTLLIKLAFSSVAKIAIIPVQDLLGLDEKSRFNSPATIGNNWLWRLPANSLNSQLATWLRSETKLFNR